MEKLESWSVGTFEIVSNVVKRDQGISTNDRCEAISSCQRSSFDPPGHVLKLNTFQSGGVILY